MRLYAGPNGISMVVFAAEAVNRNGSSVRDRKASDVSVAIRGLVGRELLRGLGMLSGVSRLYSAKSLWSRIAGWSCTVTPFRTTTAGVRDALLQFENPDVGKPLPDYSLIYSLLSTVFDPATNVASLVHCAHPDRADGARIS